MSFFSQFERGELDSHMDSNMRSHLDLACKKLKEQDEHRTEQNKRMEDAERKIELLLKNVELLSKKTDNLETNILGNRSFTWRVHNLQSFLNEAKKGNEIEKYSQPFYLQGYRMFLLLSPIRYSYSAGFFSLSYGVIKGKLDDKLTWPFKSKVSFTLVDQSDGFDKKHLIKNLKPPNQGIPRPQNDNCGTTHGSSDFVSHFTLFSRSYIKEDAILIEVELEDSDELTHFN